MYRVVFTDLAIAAAGSSMSRIEALVRDEIENLLGKEPNLSNLLFHVVESADGHEYFCQPSKEAGEAILVVDATATRQEYIPDSGLFAGETVSIPLAQGGKLAKRQEGDDK